MGKPKRSPSNKKSEHDKSKQIRHSADVVAVIRYKEGKKERPLICDPYAHLFVSPPGEEMLIAALKRWPFFSDYLIVRAKFIDDHLRNFCEKEAIKQVVILGAGNDMRAARLGFLKGRKVFEVDFPDQITNKKQILKKELGALPGNAIYVGTTLKETSFSNTLGQAGFNLEEKRLYRDHPELIVGKEITVRYFEGSSNEKGGVSVRFGTFKCLWEGEDGRDV